MRFKFDTTYIDIDRACKNLISVLIQKDFKFKPNTEYYIIIEEKKAKRTIPQNKYYWGIVINIMSDHFGYETDEMHQLLAKEFLSYEKNNVIFVKSTTKLNTKEFSIFVDKVRDWAAKEFGLHIPDANEITQEMWYELEKKYNL